MYNDHNGNTGACAHHNEPEKNLTSKAPRTLLASALTVGLLALGGCGGGSDAPPSGPNDTTDERSVDTDDSGNTGGDDSAGNTNNGGGNDNTGGTGGIDDPSTVTGSVQAFQATLYPLLTGESNCAFCHGDSNIAKPTFASVSAELSHENLLATQKVDLSAPERSRLYLRLVEDKHNCWSGSAECDADGAQMLAAIQAWADLLVDAPVTFDPLALSSASVDFAMAQVEDADTRVTDGLIAMYDFKGAGTTVTDVSGVEPLLNLQLENEVERIEGGGLSFTTGRAIASATDSQKLFDNITESMSYTFEMWVSPDNDAQTGPARIVSYSSGTGNRNFTLGQRVTEFNLRSRNTTTDTNGRPALNVGTIVPNEMYHVVATYDTELGRSIYLNGVLTSPPDAAEAIGDLSNWNASYQFVLGNETSIDRPWAGDMHLVAVYDRSLSAAEVASNFEAGLSATKTYLSFDISDLVNTPNTSIRFEVEDFDDSAYLFAAPTVISETGANFDLSGLRIAVNGKITTVGQSFADLAASVSGTEVELTPVGAVIRKEEGIDTDQIMLVFEEIAGQQNVQTSTPPTPAPLVDEPIEEPTVGVKTFDRMYASLAALTGIDPTTPELLNTYQEFRASLPGNPDPRAFSGATQTVVGKLALEFCDMWVEDSGSAQTVLTDVDFTQTPANVLGNGGAANIAGLLAGHFFTGSLSGEPLANATGELTTLLMAFENTNSTPNAIKAACQAATASAATMIQ
jgi:hypothetical protein